VLLQDGGGRQGSEQAPPAIVGATMSLIKVVSPPVANTVENGCCCTVRTSLVRNTSTVRTSLVRNIGTVRTSLVRNIGTKYRYSTYESSTQYRYSKNEFSEKCQCSSNEFSTKYKNSKNELSTKNQNNKNLLDRIVCHVDGRGAWNAGTPADGRRRTGVEV
jgi:hypothetical protein